MHGHYSNDRQKNLTAPYHWDGSKGLATSLGNKPDAPFTPC